MRILIFVGTILAVLGCTEDTSSGAPVTPPVPVIELGPGLGGSSVQSSGVSYLLACEDGTIAISSQWKIISGIEVENIGNVGGRQLANTGVDRLTCSLDDGSVLVNKQPERTTTFASAGEWICEGTDFRFTMVGLLNSRAVESIEELQRATTRPLEWQLSEETPCLFIVD